MRAGKARRGRRGRTGLTDTKGCQGGRSWMGWRSRRKNLGQTRRQGRMILPRRLMTRQTGRGSFRSGTIQWGENDLMVSKINDPWPNGSWNMKTKTSGIQTTSHPSKQKTSQSTPTSSPCSAYLKQSQLVKQTSSSLRLGRT